MNLELKTFGQEGLKHTATSEGILIWGQFLKLGCGRGVEFDRNVVWVGGKPFWSPVNAIVLKFVGQQNELTQRNVGHGGSAGVGERRVADGGAFARLDRNGFEGE